MLICTSAKLPTFLASLYFWLLFSLFLSSFHSCLILFSCLYWYLGKILEFRPKLNNWWEYLSYQNKITTNGLKISNCLRFSYPPTPLVLQCIPWCWLCFAEARKEINQIRSLTDRPSLSYTLRLSLFTFKLFTRLRVWTPFRHSDWESGHLLDTQIESLATF